MIHFLKVKNFKAIQDNTFELSNLNLFTGLNGMGKSTLIQTLLLLRQSYLNNPVHYNGELNLNGELIRLGYGKDVFSQFAPGDKLISFELKIEEDAGSWLFNLGDKGTDSDASDTLKGDFSGPNHLFNNSLFNNNFVYLSADRIGPELSYPTGSVQKIKNRRFGNRGEYAIHYLLSIAREDLFIANLKHDESKTINILDNINAWLGEISPGVKIKVTPNLDIEAIKLSIQYDAGVENVITNEFRPINVGFGLTYILSIIISILSSSPGDLVILENPEAHLHPKGQSRIGRLLSIAADNGVQLMIETHSDHILNGIRLSVKDNLIANDKIQIYYFDREKGNSNHKSVIENIKILPSGKLTSFPKGFFDEWNNALVKLVSPLK